MKKRDTKIFLFNLIIFLLHLKYIVNCNEVVNYLNFEFWI